MELEGIIWKEGFEAEIPSRVEFTHVIELEVVIESLRLGEKVELNILDLEIWKLDP